MDTRALDEVVERLAARQPALSQLSLTAKASLLKAALVATGEVAPAQVAAAAKAKGLPADSALVGEEWLAGPVVQARVMRLLSQTLSQQATRGRPVLPPKALKRLPSGQLSVEVFPLNLLDRLLFMGLSAEVVQQPGVTEATLFEPEWPAPDAKAPVALVLGAGNVASIGALDAVHKVFVEGRVTLLKLNPVNQYLEPFIKAVFAETIAAGYLSVIPGDGEVGAYLCEHPLVGEIHVTGSDQTHDAIVFGTGAEGRARKARAEPKNRRRVTSELGNVSPVVVVPGPYTPAELRFQAENVATQLTNNAGFNCNAAKLLILPEGWPLARPFMEALRAVLAALPPRPAYYPGAADRFARFTAHHPQHQVVGAAGPGALPYTLIPDVPADADDACFRQEAFCGLLAQTWLPAPDAETFLREAVRFCNEKLWGTLNACLLVHPATQARLGPALDEALYELRYGTVGLNVWPALGYGLGVTPWGASPGHPLEDIQSGRGMVHNTFLFGRVEKGILRGPFTQCPKPAWFVTHRRMAEVGRRLLALEVDPALWRVPGLAFHAYRP